MLTMNNTENDKNSSEGHYSDSEDHATSKAIFMTICVLNGPLMLTSILGNALVLTAIKRTPSIRSTSMIMLCNLAVTDLLVGLIGKPIYVADLLTKNSFISNLSVIAGFSLCGVSLLTITAISVDRFLAVHYHMKYATLVTGSRVKYTLVVIWSISFIISGINFWNKRVYHLLVGPLIVFCLIISTCCYIRIYRIVRHHQLEIRAQQQAIQGNTARNSTHVSGLRKSALNTFVFYIALIICYFPSYILVTLNGLFNMEWQPEWNFATTAVFINSSINPFLYFWRLRELRTAIVETVRHLLCKQTEVD
ncbi:histamine H2 receptor-like [Oculina patagonica]